MPELPEVETLCRQLNEFLPGKEIWTVEVLDQRLGHVEGLAGREIEVVSRCGKFIQIGLVGGLTATLHLRMTGRLLWQVTGAPLPPYARLVLTFSSGRLVLIDPRRFATFCVAAKKITAALVPDPLKGFPPRRLREIARTRRLPLKSFLMDQRLIAGIGNIYACEILHRAAVDPRRPAGSLSATEWRAMSQAAEEILHRAVVCRGTTVSDWRDLYGCGGTNQDHLKVYGRQGKPCPRCGCAIERATLSGRGTWFCPSCQR
jgi:formamidopyrimidine-DNA glycosylase